MSSDINLMKYHAIPETDEPVKAVEPSGLKKWLPLLVLSLALTIIILDTTILNVSLRTIIGDLNTTIQKIQWVITAYSLMLAAFTITGGRLGDLFGRKKMFALGAIIFAVGSFITSISHTVGIMIIGEAIVEGIGACLMMPATSALLLSNYKGRDRSVAFGIWGGIIAAAAALGPVVGGWLTKNYSWRWAFRINIFVALLLVVGALFIRESRDTEEKPGIDFIGIILSSLGLLSIVFGVIQSSTYGWFIAKEKFIAFSHTINLGNLSATPIFIAIGVAILGLFLLWEKFVASRGQTPLVSLKLFRNRQFIVGATVTAILALAQTGLAFSIPVFFQAVKNLDPLQTGLAMIPLTAVILIAAPLSSFLSKYINPKRIIQAGLFIDVIGFIVLYYTLNVNATTWSLAPGFAIFGFGMGLIFAQASNLTLSAVSVQEAGEASGVNNTLRQIGATFGAAIMGTILISTLTSHLISGINNSTVIPDSAKTQISQAVETQSSNIEFGSGANFGSNDIPQTIKDEITTISHQATTDGNRIVILYGMIFMALGLLISTRLPNSSDIEIEQSVAETPIISNNSPSNRMVTAVVISAIIFGSAAGAAGYYAGSHKKIATVPQTVTKKIPTGEDFANFFKSNTQTGETAQAQTTDTETTEQTNDVNTNPATQPINTDTQDIAENQTPAQTPPETQQQIVEQTPETTQEPAITANEAPVTKKYTSTTLHLSISIPSTWTTKTADNELLITTTEKQTFNLQMYDIGTSDNSSLNDFLTKQPNLHNITAAKISGHDGWQFIIDSTYHHGFAFLDNGKLYYMLGSGIENSAIAKTFKTL